MPTYKITKEEYLNKDFDYSKLTKQELRQIMSENNVEDIPPLTALKSTILDAYKRNIHGKIDYLRGNFSTENIFQSERKEKNDTASTSILSHHHRDSQDSLANESLSALMNTSEINSTAFRESPRSKHPFIAVSKKKVNDSVISDKSQSAISQTATPREKRCKSLCWKLRLLWLVLSGLCIYLKFFCPYCKPGASICIPTPPHAYLKNGQLMCDNGYRLVRGLVNICVVDDKNEREILEKIDSCIKMLEYLKGDFDYGFSKSQKIKLSLLTSDERVISGLQKSCKVVISGDFVQARNARISIRTFFRFYFFLLFKVWTILLIIFISLKVWLNKRRRAKMLNARALSISKDILEILNRQIMMSVKSSQFRPFVYEEQIKDALEIKDDVWPFIKNIVEKNSNVEKQVDGNRKTIWKWIGPVLYKTEAMDAQ